MVKVNIKIKQLFFFNMPLCCFLLVACGGGGGGGVGSALRPTFHTSSPSSASSTRPQPSAPFPSGQTVFLKAQTPTTFAQTQTQLQDNFQDENKLRNIGIVDGFFDGYEKADSTKQRLNMKNATISDTKSSIQGHGAKVAHLIATHTTLSPLSAWDGGNNQGSVNLSAQPYLITLKDSHIFNNSIGTNPTQDMQQVKQYQNQLYNYINKLTASKIFVWAVGNESQNMANDQASLPSLPEYQNARKGFIAVTSVDGQNRFATGVNKIGERAKMWGIAAPHEHCFLENQCGQGTSFATPLVTAAAANVWEKYPWMDNHLVVQTILSTANQEGTTSTLTEGPNPTIGWGVLDQNRALNGPARFDKRLLLDNKEMVEVNLDYRNYTDQNKLTWSNDIKGDAGLHKKGTGTLILSGTNSYTGETKIEGGELKLKDGNNQNSPITIETDGMLTLENSQTQAITNKGGSLNVRGKVSIKDYNNESGDAKIFADAASQIEAKTMNLQNTKLIVDATNMQVTSISSTPQTHTLLRAQKIENFNGTYFVLGNLSAFTQVKELLYNDTEMQISHSRNSTQAVVKSLSYDNKRTRRAADNFENLLLSLEDEKDSTVPLYTAALEVINADVKAMPTIIDTLTGEIHSTSNHILAKQNELVHHKISQRLNYLRRQDDSGIYTGALQSKFKLSSDIYAGADVRLNAFFLGTDARIDERSMLGFVFLNANSDANFDKFAGQTQVKNRNFSLYGSYDFDSFYLLGSLGMGFATSEVNRPIHQTFSQSSHKDKLTNAYVELGKEWPHHSVIFTPFTAFSNENISKGAFSENANLGFRAEKKNYHLNKIIGGLRGTMLFNAIELEGELRHSFALNPSNFDFEASWKSHAAANIKGMRQNKHLTFANFTMIYYLSPYFKLDTQYDISFKNLKKKEGHIFNIGLRYAY